MELAFGIIALLGKQSIGKFKRITEADTTMAIGPCLAAKKVLCRRVMQIDVVFIWEHKLHQPESIALGGRLLDRVRERALSVFRKVDLAARHFAPTAVIKLQMPCCVGVALHHREILFCGNGAWHIPSWIDNQVFHDIGKLGRAALTVIRPYDGTGFKSHFPIVDDPR